MKKLIIFALCSAMLLTSCQGKATDSTPVDNGNYQYGVVTTAVGNELTIELGTVAAQESSNSMPQGERPDFEDGEMPSPAEGDIPTPQSGEAPSGKGNRGEGMGRGGTAVEKTGESKTYSLNVNTPVYMEMGSRSVETTFANIKSGDIVKLTIADDTVTAVSIIGQEASANASN